MLNANHLPSPSLVGAGSAGDNPLLGDGVAVGSTLDTPFGHITASSVAMMDQLWQSSAIAASHQQQQHHSATQPSPAGQFSAQQHQPAPNANNMPVSALSALVAGGGGVGTPPQQGLHQAGKGLESVVGHAPSTPHMPNFHSPFAMGVGGGAIHQMTAGNHAASALHSVLGNGGGGMDGQHGQGNTNTVTFHSPYTTAAAVRDWPSIAYPSCLLPQAGSAGCPFPSATPTSGSASSTSSASFNPFNAFSIHHCPSTIGAIGAFNAMPTSPFHQLGK